MKCLFNALSLPPHCSLLHFPLVAMVRFYELVNDFSLERALSCQWRGTFRIAVTSGPTFSSSALALLFSPSLPLFLRFFAVFFAIFWPIPEREPLLCEPSSSWRSGRLEGSCRFLSLCSPSFDHCPFPCILIFDIYSVGESAVRVTDCRAQEGLLGLRSRRQRCD